MDFQSTAATCWATDPYTRHLLCKLLDSNQRPIVWQTIAQPAELNSLQVYICWKCLYGCERWDSNSRYPAYEAGDLTSCPLRNGCTRRIRTLSFGYEPNELPLLHQCYIKMGSYKVIPRTIWKEMKNRSKTYIWRDGESFIIMVCNPLWELPFGYSVLTRMTDVLGADGWIWTTDFHLMRVALWPTELHRHGPGLT